MDQCPNRLKYTHAKRIIFKYLVRCKPFEGSLKSSDPSDAHIEKRALGHTVLQLE